MLDCRILITDKYFLTVTGLSKIYTAHKFIKLGLSRGHGSETARGTMPSQSMYHLEYST